MLLSSLGLPLAGIAAFLVASLSAEDVTLQLEPVIRTGAGQQWQSPAPATAFTARRLQPAIQEAFPHNIELLGLIAKEGNSQVSALLNIRGNHLFIKLGDERPIPGASGNVLFAKFGKK